jgi:hypothetical protein
LLNAIPHVHLEGGFETLARSVREITLVEGPGRLRYGLDHVHLLSFGIGYQNRALIQDLSAIGIIDRGPLEVAVIGLMSWLDNLQSILGVRRLHL